MSLNDSNKTEDTLPKPVTLLINSDTKRELRKTQPAFAEIVGKLYVSGVSEPYDLIICRVSENIKNIEKKIPNGNYFVYAYGMGIFQSREFNNNSLLNHIEDSELIRKSIIDYPYYAEFQKNPFNKKVQALPSVTCTLHVFNVEELKTFLKNIEADIQKKLDESKNVVADLGPMFKF